MGTLRSDGGAAEYDAAKGINSAALPVVVEVHHAPTTRRDNGDEATDRTYSITTGVVEKR